MAVESEEVKSHTLVAIPPMVKRSADYGVKRQAKVAVGNLAAAVGLYRKALRSKMIIVAFHRVSDGIPEDGITCSSAKFAEFCHFFGEHFEVVRLAEQVAACRKGTNLGGTLSITFDDGYRDNYEIAAPILRSCGLSATIFVTTAFINSVMVPAWDLRLAAQPGWMTWDQLRALQAEGFDIGSHTETHLDMAASDPDVVRKELIRSKSTLERELGSHVDLFAYPFGGPEHISERARELVREVGFSCCVSCHGGINSPGADPFRLKRIGISEWPLTTAEFGFDLIFGRI